MSIEASAWPAPVCLLHPDVHVTVPCTAVVLVLTQRAGRTLRIGERGPARGRKPGRIARTVGVSAGLRPCCDSSPRRGLVNRGTATRPQEMGRRGLRAEVDRGGHSCEGRLSELSEPPRHGPPLRSRRFGGAPSAERRSVALPPRGGQSDSRQAHDRPDTTPRMSLPRLHSSHAVSRLPSVVDPPATTGTTWSTWRTSP